jgi:RNA polymerase sigma factor (sigma-70 family)
MNIFRTAYNSDWEHIYQVGVQGLIKAAKKFDLSKGTITTFANRFIIHEIYKEIRFMSKQNKYVSCSLDDILFTNDEGVGVTKGDTLEYLESGYDKVVYNTSKNNIIKRLLLRLTGLKKEILKIKIENPKRNQEDIAKILGCSQATVSRALLEAKEIYKNL